MCAADSSPLSSVMIASYGRQILEAVLYLYQLGLSPPLGHIHTGNIFLEGEYCRLGGIENWLLGYKPHLLQLFQSSGCHGDLDAILFGELSRCAFCSNINASYQDM